MENTGLQLSDLKVNNLPELQGWKGKQEKLVSENPFVEITDNKTYEVACKSRTALLKGRTELEKQDKLIASQLTSFKKDVKSETDNLIAITLPFEERQQTEVKRYEAIKIAEKEEEARLEQERIDKIKTKIDLFETDSYKIIQETTIENVEMHKTMLDAFVNDEFDYEEYDVMFELAKIRVQTSWDAKCKDIKEKEEQRLENKAMKKEIFDVRIIRLKEVGFDVYHEVLKMDKEALSAVEDKVLNASSSEFEEMLSEVKKSNEEAQQILRDAELKKENEKIFEIRKNRLIEIGFILNEERDGFFWLLEEKEKYAIRMGRVFESDAIRFETDFTEAKLFIEKAKSDAEELEKQKAIDLKLAEEDVERLKKENKQRVAKYSSDKKLLKEFVKSLEFSNPVPELENEDLQPILDNILLELQNTRGHLLTQINLF